MGGHPLPAHDRCTIHLEDVIADMTSVSAGPDALLQAAARITQALTDLAPGDLLLVRAGGENNRVKSLHFLVALHQVGDLDHGLSHSASFSGSASAPVSDGSVSDGPASAAAVRVAVEMTIKRGYR